MGDFDFACSAKKITVLDPSTVFSYVSLRIKRWISVNYILQLCVRKNLDKKQSFLPIKLRCKLAAQWFTYIITSGYRSRTDSETYSSRSFTAKCKSTEKQWKNTHKKLVLNVKYWLRFVASKIYLTKFHIVLYVNWPYSFLSVLPAGENRTVICLAEQYFAGRKKTSILFEQFQSKWAVVSAKLFLTNNGTKSLLN